MENLTNSELERFFDVAEKVFDLVILEAFEERVTQKSGHSLVPDLKDFDFEANRVTAYAYRTATCGCCPDQDYGLTVLDHSEIKRFAELNANPHVKLEDVAFFLEHSNIVLAAAEALADNVASYKKKNSSTSFVGINESGGIAFANFSHEEHHYLGEDSFLGYVSIYLNDLLNENTTLETAKKIAEAEAKELEENKARLAAERVTKETEARKQALIQLANEFSDEYTLISKKTGAVLNETQQIP